MKLTIHIRRSRYALFWLCGLHSLMLMTLVRWVSSAAAAWLLSLLLIISLIYHCRQYQWLENQQAITCLICTEAHWTLFQKKGTSIKPLALTACVLSQFVVILYFQGHDKRQRKTVVLFADAVDPDELRKLRQYCRRTLS